MKAKLSDVPVHELRLSCGCLVRLGKWKTKVAAGCDVVEDACAEKTRRYGCQIKGLDDYLWVRADVDVDYDPLAIELMEQFE